ncbi:TAP-like protein-domain-containing protein [Xylariaceae sp. FL0594]|nr:TAP-like protein-domain-containing protein [Xylariaceae sp. FL0594]
MHFHLSALLALCSFVLAACSRNCTWDTITPSRYLVWCSCYDGFFCAKLDVPLDYHNAALGRASIPLIKLPAKINSSQGPYQGMILTNPGGPGGSGVDEIQHNGVAFYQSLAGDNWDIVGFDTRGIYRSEPNINCSITPDKLSSRFVPEVPDNFFTSYIDAGIEHGKRCHAIAGGPKDAGPHISTWTNARDLLSIVDTFARTADGKRAREPSHLLNYIGYSYGTFLGQVFASMFPDRVGKMVLDGVLGLELPLGENFTAITSPADGVIASFFIYCFAAGPTKCSFYTGSSPRDMYARFNASFVQLDAQRAKVENWTNATAIEAALLTLKTALFYSVASPNIFGPLSDALVGLEQALAIGDVGLWTRQVTPLIGDPTPVGDVNPEYRLGTLCADQGNRWYNKTLEDLRPAIEHFENASIIGEILPKSMLGCLGWSIEATHVFSGPFGGNTKTPILFVGNTYDPVAPASEAVAAARKYKRAHVVTVDGIGHTSRVVGNACQIRKVNAYFRETLTDRSSFCELEAGPFGVVLNGTLDDIIEQAGLSQLV